MKKIAIILIIIIIALFVIINLKEKTKENQKNNISSKLQDKNTKGDENVDKININIDGTNYRAILEDNETVKSLIAKLPLKITMNELNGNEKYYYLDESLPNNPKRVNKIEVGDIMLYGSDCLVIFYDNFKTPYSYTKIGKIENPDSLKELETKKNVEVEITK